MCEHPATPDWDLFQDCHEACELMVANLRVKVDTLEVAKEVEKHRWHWRPKDVRVVLLAESHVFTKDDDCHNLEYQGLPGTSGLPERFVRFVYCLGYGERFIAPAHVQKNRGTPQYWKVFYSCLNHVEDNDDFAPILVGGTPNFAERIRNKLRVLEKIRDSGIWLADASIVGIYKPGGEQGLAGMEDIVTTSWDQYVSRVLKEANPKILICIGKTLYGTSGILRSRVEDLGFRFEVLPQPQARLPTEVHIACYQRYYEICQEYGNWN